MGRVDLDSLEAARKRWALRWVPEEEQCEAAARYAFECQRRTSIDCAQKLVELSRAKQTKTVLGKLVSCMNDLPLSHGLECDTKGEYKSATTRVEWSRFRKAWMGGVEWAQQDES